MALTMRLQLRIDEDSTYRLALIDRLLARVEKVQAGPRVAPGGWGEARGGRDGGEADVPAGGHQQGCAAALAEADHACVMVRVRVRWEVGELGLGSGSGCRLGSGGGQGEDGRQREAEGINGSASR